MYRDVWKMVELEKMGFHEERGHWMYMALKDVSGL